MKNVNVISNKVSLSKIFFYLLLALSLAFSANCGKKKKKAMFWMAALTGGGSTTSSTGTPQQADSKRQYPGSV